MDPTTNDPTNINPVPATDPAAPTPNVDPVPATSGDLPVTAPAPEQPLNDAAPVVNPFPGDATPADSVAVGETITPTDTATDSATESTPSLDAAPALEGVSSPVDDTPAPATDASQPESPDANQTLGSF